MHTILLIGMTGTGKSPFIRNYSEGRNLFVFDIQNEYGSRTKYPGQVPMNLSDNWTEPRARHIQLDEKLFIQQCTRKQNTICVFEDATAFMEGKTDKDLRRLIVAKLFTRNVYIFVFHCIMAVPPRIMQLSDYVVLFQTNDEAYQVENKFPSIYPHYLQLKGKTKADKIIIKTLN
jgi:hypothetical protein